MDWTTILKAQQTDFIQRLKSGDLLHCKKEGQHSELTVISGERLKQLRDFCWEMANKFKQQSDVKNIFFNNMKGKLGEEVVKICLGDFVTEIDYEKRIGGDGKIDFTLTSDPSIGIQLKTRYGYFDKVQWTIDREEIEKNAVLVCILCQEEFSDTEKEYGLIIAGFLPTNIIKSSGDKTLIGIDELLYPGGLHGYLENLSFYDADKYISLGDECINNLDYQGAITNYSQALQLNPKNAEIYFKRAETHHQLGNFRDAINDYSQAIYINPKDTYSYNNRGIIYEKFGYIDYAINDYEKALKINPKEAVVYLNLAITYYNLDVDCNYYNYIINRDELIINYLNQALNINPNFYKAYYVRGKVRFQIGDVVGAFEDFNIVLKSYPDYALNIYTYLAEVYYYRGNYYSEIGNNKNALENLNLAANLYKRLNNEFSYGSTINYIQYVQSKYFEYFDDDDKYYHFILNSNNKSLEVNNVDLKSAVGMNYTRLRDLLKAGNWKEADKETRRVMLSVGKREKEGWLDTKSIDNFPCEDLLTIDQLWVKYSDGKFGFSVQNKIYQSLEGTRDYDQKIWDAFGDKVGWRKEGSWLRYSYITFDKRSPEGHLPVCIRLSDVGGWLLGGAVFFRVETCKLFVVQEKQPEIAPTPEPINQEVQLKSSRGMDYRKLRDLLKAGKLKEADEETARVMLMVANREQEGWLDVKHIDNFPWVDLCTIDQLWVKYSDGKFGFSVQNLIYQGLGGTRGYSREIWEKFGDKVGWRKGGSWLYYSDITFDNKAPAGHLPRRELWMVGSGHWLYFIVLFSRVETYKLFVVQERQPQIIPTPQPVNQEIQLMDYSKLRDLLKAGKWKEADEETRRVMLAVAKREKEGCLDVEHIDNFPCTDLRTIDQLWVGYSNGKFGFSVQKRIYQGLCEKILQVFREDYQDLGETRNYDEKIWQTFGDQVGWTKGGSLLYYSNIKKGRLPCEWVTSSDVSVLWSLLSRRDL